MFFPQQATLPHQKPLNATISLTHDFAHVNFLIDLTTSTLDWQDLLPNLIPENKGHLLIGWGEKQVYMTTPTWADLRASVAISALMINTPSIMHVHYLPYHPNQQLHVTPLLLSDASVATIEQQIVNSFATGANKQNNTPQLLSPGYGANDQFYYAEGSYNLFSTCNTWVGNILHKAGISVSRWTPFSYNVIYSIPASLKGRT